MTYTEAVIAQIRASEWYVGDGGFIAQAMEATTLEEATETGEMWSAQAHTELPFVFNNARFADSDLEGTLPFFAVCDAVNTETGETGKVSCGGARVVATLFRACQQGWFPFTAKFVSVQLTKETAALNLVVVPTKVKATTK